MAASSAPAPPAPPAPPQCPVCHDLLFEAMVAPCGHSLCSECTGKIDGSRDRRCPTCRDGVYKYAPNYTVRELVETAFPAAHRERVLRTTRGQVKKILDENPGFAIEKKEHDDEFILFLLVVLRDASSALGVCDAIGGAFDGVSVVAHAPLVTEDGSDPVTVSFWTSFASRVRSNRMTIRVGSRDRNPVPKRRPATDAAAGGRATTVARVLLPDAASEFTRRLLEARPYYARTLNE